MTTREALQKASRFLQAENIEDALFLAEYALRHALGWDRTTLFARMNEPLSADTWACVEAIIRRRAAGEPMQYITGEQEFYGLTFEVNPDVLIPRPETELLVEEVLKQARQMWFNKSVLHVADIGTGSGAIVVTLAVEGEENWAYTAVDIAQASLDTARRNAERHGVASRINFVQGDLLVPLLDGGRRVDILVSNPPYIPSFDVTQLDTQVKDHEPLRALDGGEDGFDFYRRMVRELPHVLAERAIVGWEVGIHQADTVQAWLVDTGLFDRVYIVDDLAGIGRHVIGIKL
ncbi:peptide chain release factor N(5)-glutamine methyltransferase [Aneurinibacillus soli]|nr:peptide chain release factor N(5)-glutamine methyltransferase [Aneurinibacillus soli]